MFWPSSSPYPSSEAGGVWKPQPVLLIINKVERYFCLSYLMTDSGSGSREYAWHLSLPAETWLERKDLPSFGF